MRPYYRFAYKVVESVTLGVFHVSFTGRENVPTGGCLIVGNHASYFDPTTIAWAAGREMYYLARKSLFKPPLMDWFLPICNVLPLDRDGGTDMSGLRRIIKMLQTGHMVMLFPEGTRTTDGKLQPAQAGAGFIAAKAQVPILPTRVFGTYEAWPKGQILPRYHPLRVTIGKPFLPPADAKTKEDYEALANRMMQEIGKLE
jgi:1-acyl-sn-glycerol-3-phosphate acyltransferase